jgi:hypothetical protein
VSSTVRFPSNKVLTENYLDADIRGSLRANFAPEVDIWMTIGNAAASRIER